MEQPFFFDPATLDPLADEYGPGFNSARPFRNTVIDGFFPDQLLEEVISELPGPEEWDKHPEWRNADRTDAKKLMVNRDWMLGPMTRHLLSQFNSASFVNFLEKLTLIDGLVPDPHFFGGGLHQIEAGGFLKVHADFNIHNRLKLDRRLNAILYLNRDWDDAWGGHLEMWDRDMTHLVKRIAPEFNRLVIFETTDFSFHGHPDPLACPPGTRRRSLALYYYSNGRPEHERSGKHGTLHQVRPGEDFDPHANQKIRQAEKEAADKAVAARPTITFRDFVPPVASKLKAYIESKRS